MTNPALTSFKMPVDRCIKNTCIKKLARDGKRLAFATGPGRIEEFRENRAESVE